MGSSGCRLKDGGVGQHSRNISSPRLHGGSRDSSCSNTGDSPPPPPPQVSSSRGPSAVELIEEISALEHEIVHLEKHLLSLYRTAFGQCIAGSPTTSQQPDLSTSSCRESHIEEDQRLAKCSKMSVDLQTSSADGTFRASKTNQYTGIGHCKKVASSYYNFDKDHRTHVRAVSDHSYLAGENVKKDIAVAPSNQILADHLCTSLRETLLDSPCKLSEDIIRCISAVYCKLNDARVSQTLTSSPFSSLSSSSTFSLQDHQSDNWSPRLNYGIVSSPIKDKCDAFPEMVEISRISINKERFKCAATLLERYRNLIKRLEAVDPTKFGHEEKLAFWINIHNAMLMHAFVAYGLENTSIKIAPTILKKSYNVGGRNINAYGIKNSIFGCGSHHKVSRSLFSPSMKLTTINSRHPYALKHREPLVHFALSMGVHSDPPVRAYTAKNVIKQLEIAKKEFIQASVTPQKGNKVLLPKILELYAKDASLDLSSLLKSVHDCLPSDKQQSLQECLKGRPDRHTQWSPYKSTFRYILHGDLDINK